MRGFKEEIEKQSNAWAEHKEYGYGTTISDKVLF